MDRFPDLSYGERARIFHMLRDTTLGITIPRSLLLQANQVIE
jgi:hypothetical protein